MRVLQGEAGNPYQRNTFGVSVGGSHSWAARPGVFSLGHELIHFISRLSGLAALNRETSGLIPFMLVMHSLYTRPTKERLQYEIAIATVALGVYALVFGGLRYAYGEQVLVLPYGNHPGFEVV